ncbi:hypothetical protein C8J56DRAFT_834499, partial [Mycena floridula]
LHIPGLWAVENLHSTATLSPEGFGSFNVSRGINFLNISLPTSVTLTAWGLFFVSRQS